MEFTSHRVVSSLEFCAVRVVFQEVLEAFAEPCPSGQELRVVQSREVNWTAWLPGSARGALLVTSAVAWQSFTSSLK